MSSVDQDFYRLVAEARDPARLFAVRSDKRRGFYAGHLPGAMQALVGRTEAERVVVVSFSESGNLYEVRRRTLPRFHQPPEERFQEVNDAEFHAFLSATFGFVPGLILVHPFAVADDECDFGVTSLPWHYDDFLAAPEQHSPEAQADFRQLIAEFIGRKVGVLEWRNDWWVLEADGMEAGWERPDDPQGGV